MPFGLVNAPFTFQDLMDDTLGDLKPNVAVPYLDDVNCHSAGTPMEHVEKIKLVFDRFLEAGLRPNWEKCKFLYSELDCFGHIVTKNGVRIDPTRLERLKGIKKLENVHDVRLFLGLCCVYYRFIKNYAILAEPLIRLTRKDVPWRWTAKEEEALESLKKSVINATFLSIPRADIPFRIRMDSSEFAAGYYLYQQIDGRERIIAFGGKTYNGAQRNHGPGHKELYAVYLALKEFRWCIYGREVFVETDHQAWSWVNAVKQPPKACASWLMELLDYNPKIDWIPGKFNTVADVLSRLWKSPEFNALDVETVPHEEKLRIARSVHGDTAWGDHLSAKKTVEKLKSRFLWKDMRRDVEQICKECPDCSINKKQRVKAPLTPIVATRPWNIIGVDIVGPFPESPDHPYRNILIVVDYFSKWVELLPMENASGSLVADLMRRKIFGRYGNPSLVVSDDGSQFVKSAEFNALLARLNIARANAAVEHQQANGEVEAMVRLMKPLLRIKAQNNSSKWPFCLEDVMSSRNSAKSSSTNDSPFKILYGYEPVITIEAEYRNVDPVARARFDKVNEEIGKSKKVQEEQYNKSSTKVNEYMPNDEVLIRTLGKHQPALGPVYDKSPSKILEKRGENSYNVQRPNGATVAVNVKDLKLAPPSLKSSARAKEIVPSTKPVVVPVDDYVGKRVEVYWPQYKKYFPGTIVKKNDAKNRFKSKGSHIIRYDDDGKEYYEWLTGSPPSGQSLEKFIITQEDSSSSKNVDYKSLDKSLPQEKLFAEESEDEDFSPDELDLDSDSDSIFNDNSSDL
jgi:cleavage and polyadenylation specificity factor subunit 1